MPNPWGKHLLASQLKKFLMATNGYYAPATQKERTRKARRISEKIVKLGAEPNVNKWTREDVLRWKDYIDRDLDNATKVKYWRFLREMFEFYDIDILRKMIYKREIRMPKVPPKEIRSLKEETVWNINRAVQYMDGWWGDIARFVTLAYPFTGLRPSELRKQRFQDLDVANWTMTVSCPKGGDTYGRKRTVAIPPLIRNAFMDYLEARKRYLKGLGESENVEMLIPYEAREGVTYWQDARWRALKRHISIHTGIPFRWKDYRSSFCQMAINKGMNLQSVSKMMGHATTMTTELFYGRIKDSPAIAEMNRVFSEPGPEILVVKTK